MALLEASGIGKNFGDTKVLKDISLTLEQGEALAIIGSSGSGKTTLLRCLNFLERLGVQAVGVSGKDGGLLKVKKKYSNGEDIGFVGEITDVNPKILYDLLEKDFLPIVCPIGLDDEYNTYNINADDAACAIARAVSAEKLAFLTDIEGVYKDPSDKNTLISELTVSDAKKLIGDGFIGGGMLPKLNNCIDAIDNGVSRVHILDGRIAHCLLLEIFTNRGIGTAILGDSEEKFNNEQ